MTMAEFNIRLFSFNRQCERQDMLFREVAYYSMIGSHLNPKKLPKTKQQFWTLQSEQTMTEQRMETMKQAIIKAREQYNNRNNV
jgi:hypothetical protein